MLASLVARSATCDASEEYLAIDDTPLGHTAGVQDRFRAVAAFAAAHHSVISTDQLEALDVTKSLRHQWLRSGRLVRLGVRSFAAGGSASTWHRELAAGLADLAGHGLIAGRAAAQLYGLDGFDADAHEYLIDREHRGYRTFGVVASTAVPILRSDLGRIAGLAVLRPERLILDAPLFGFSGHEVGNAIDSAIRLRLISEQRLRTAVVARHRRGINHGRILLDALIDSGGQSRLERMFVRLIREAGLPRPEPQRTYRDGSRVVARVDFRFPNGLLVEVNGFGFHSTRAQLQRDAQRHTELTLRGHRLLTFTYDDLRYRPAWVASQLRVGTTAVTA